ncbi:MAG: SIR2 family protein [Desulfobacteraceae bacterium]|nr:SIR2 family protein [Desulfobacteraceae bacterium]
MSIPLSNMIARIEPHQTVLFFGSGSSLPSGAPSVDKIISHLSKTFQIDSNGYTLSEIASLAEEKGGRRALITSIRQLFKLPSVTGSLLNLPLYNWKNIYTTNYDQLIEQSYSRKNTPLNVYSSNFDFTVQSVPEATKLFKLHGTIEKDIIDGSNSRIIITESDYDNTIDYREDLYNSLKNDLSGATLVIIGYSLSDPQIKDIVNRSIDINNKTHNPFSINLLLYSGDGNRSILYEKRGIKVAFGGLDDFLIEISKKFEPSTVCYSFSDNPLDIAPTLNSITIDVAHEICSREKNVNAMYQGWPASYADIEAQITFERTLLSEVESSFENGKVCTVILGASGIGKTTFARQIMLCLHKKHFHCWEHKNEHTLQYEMWRNIAREMHSKGKTGILFIDDAHAHLYEINNLIDLLISDGINNLKLLLTSTRNQWYPRIKTPNIFKNGCQFVLKKLDESEVENLLTLVDTSPDIRLLVENSFIGFSRTERKRRLTTKCESDTFVCLKNIFASEKFDDIILREYAGLEEKYRDIYRLVSAMESSGIIVHRQLVIRLLGIPAAEVQASLINLVDIISEYTVSDREGIYGWKGRHPVITDIITKYKMADENEFYKLIETVIENILPTYDIEIRTIRQLCGFHSGIGRFPDKQRRNRLLRKLISKAPGERVPRHRLIRNLIELNEFDKAETEIRLFENDFKLDGPVRRYKIILMLARAQNAPGILPEDRISILVKARDQALIAIDLHPENKDILRTYCDVGFEYFKMTGNLEYFDEAMRNLREAEERIGDPEITSILITYERKLAGVEYEDDGD